MIGELMHKQIVYTECYKFEGEYRVLENGKKCRND